MLKIVQNTKGLSKSELSLIRKYYKFVVDKFVSKKVQRTSIVNLVITNPEQLEDPEERKELVKFTAWMFYQGIQNEKKVFDITINATLINKKAKKPITRLKNFLKDFGHELVHVKQYLNGEVRDYIDGSYRYMRQKYPPLLPGDSENYWNSPDEIEAYGRMEGLYQMFLNELKNEKVVQKKKD